MDSSTNTSLLDGQTDAFGILSDNKENQNSFPFKIDCFCLQFYCLALKIGLKTDLLLLQ